MAPVYFVTGNHEWWSGNFKLLENKLKGIGVKILRNRREEISQQGEKLYILGIDDPEGSQYGGTGDSLYSLREISKDLPENVFTVLLAHRPEIIEYYSAYSIDLVLSGHAHGGQVRFPFTRWSLVAPGQGYFPKYTAGLYRDLDTTMAVNRGLGNSIIPQRLFNRPEVTVINLQKK